MTCMLRLRTLGGLAVEGEPPPAFGAATQRRPLALLALLAAGRDRGVSRDKLLAYLWPDSSAEKARHLLNQALYALRRSLAADDLFLGSSELRLNSTALTADMREFEEALDRRDLERAVALYAGPFLDGFFLNAAPEFEHWVDTQRERLAARAATALETLAAAETAAGRHRAAVDWWRRLSVVDPLNSRHAYGLMEALVAAGDRAAALRHAHAHAQLLAEDLGTSPDAQVAMLEQRLRQEAGDGGVGERATVRRPVAPGRPFAAALADRYTVERKLGRGGTTTVYLARERKHNRAVALKVLHPELSSALAADRFLRQIRLLAPLRHPHLLPLYDSGEAEGFLFLVTPYVDGGSLRARLARERTLPVGEAVALACEVADALEYAHAHNVLHRNIKPEHILLDASHAVVAGFGIVRALEVAHEEELTAEGLRVGTPPYMSPEQTACLTLDGRSDLYSLACVLYELLSGSPPPRGRDLPPLRALRPEVPGAVETALARALALAPADRFDTASAFARALTA